MTKILFHFLLFFCLTSCAQSPRADERKVILPAIDPYFVVSADTISPYGPRDITRNVLQSRDGSIWFASWEGIIRYDGQLFINITLQKSLKPFRVFSLMEDREGNLWFGTIGAGVYRYDGKSFINFTTENGLVGNGVECLLQDKRGNIWLGTDKGASCYDGKSFTSYTVKDGLASNAVHSIVQDRTGKLWFGTDTGVNCYEDKSFTDFKSNTGYPFVNIRSIIEDKTGNIWIGGEDGLYNTKSRSMLTESFVGYVFEDKTGDLWLSANDTARGMDLISLDGRPVRKNNGMVLYRYDGNSLNRIFDNDNQVFGITEDRDGNIWFGTADGIYRYDGKLFENFKKK